MRHLQPAQYASWLKKAHDPEWIEHRYRTPVDGAMASAILDLEECMAIAKELREALEEITPPMLHENATCHVGICSQAECGQCGRIMRANAAIERAKSEGL